MECTPRLLSGAIPEYTRCPAPRGAVFTVFTPWTPLSHSPCVACLPYPFNFELWSRLKFYFTTNCWGSQSLSAGPTPKDVHTHCWGSHP